MLSFEECIESIHAGSVISFREYVLDRHERKQLSLSISDGVVQTVFPANQQLSRETLEQYYGIELDDVDYLQLSQMNCPRVVINLGLNQNNEIDIKILVLNKDFYNTGLQEITVTNELNLSESEPIYLQAQKGW